MKITSPRFALSALALGLGLSFTTLTSCKDNDLSDGGNNPGSDTEQTEDKLAQKYNALESLLGALGDVDSLPDNWNSTSYHVDPTIGVAESEGAPYSVRLIATTDANEANREFRSLISAPLGGAAKDTTWTQEGIGTLNFKVSQNDPTCYATVTCNLQQMPKLQEIRFVPASVIGNNASNKTAFYQFGDIIKQTIDGKETYWVCVRPASKKSDDLGKSHWCTFQLVPTGKKNANYKQVNEDNFLPTDLCGKRPEGIRMTQNFFNVLRIMANPEALSSSTNLDKIVVSDNDPDKIEFSLEEAQDISYIWNFKDYWRDVLNSGFNTGERDELTHEYSGADFKKFIGGENVALSAFFYGYSTVYFGKGDYRVYNIDLSASGTTRLFTNATECTSLLYKNFAHRFQMFEEAGKDQKYLEKKFKLNEDDNNKYEHQYIVKYRTGGEFDNTWNSKDKDYSKSFTERSSNGITDVFVSKQMRKMESTKAGHGFFVAGDQINNGVANQICIKGYKEAYNDLTDDESKEAIFLHVSQGNQEANDEYVVSEVSDKLAHVILLQLVRAYEYDKDNNSGFSLIKLENCDLAEKQIAQKIFKRIYSVCGNRIEVGTEGNQRFLRIKLKTAQGEACYQVEYDMNGNYEFSKYDGNVNKEPITVCGYDDKTAFSETYTSTCFKSSGSNNNAVRSLISEFRTLRDYVRTELTGDIEACF